MSDSVVEKLKCLVVVWLEEDAFRDDRGIKDVYRDDQEGNDSDTVEGNLRKVPPWMLDLSEDLRPLIRMRRLGFERKGRLT